MFVGHPKHELRGDGKLHLWQVEKGKIKPLTRKIIEDFDINVVQLHNNQFIGTRGIEEAQKMGIPTVWVFHDFWTLCPQRFMIRVWQAMDYDACYKINADKCIKCVGRYNYEMTRRQREIINKCDAGIVPSERHIKIFEDNNLLVGKWKIIKPWIDLEFFNIMKNVNKNPWQVFFAGNYIAHKGIQVLLKAWKMVNKRLPMAHLVAQGDYRSLDLVVNLAKSLNLMNVHFVERMPPESLRGTYNESAIVVFPSIWEETVGLIWLEALACGTPVICSRTGSIPELLKYGGEMFEPRNHVELAEKIVDMLLLPKKRYKMAKEGYDYVRRNFDSRRAGDDFTKLYYELDLRNDI